MLRYRQAIADKERHALDGQGRRSPAYIISICRGGLENHYDKADIRQKTQISSQFANFFASSSSRQTASCPKLPVSSHRIRPICAWYRPNKAG
jgi:hypothetical protein